MTDRPDDPIVRLVSALIEGDVEFIVVGGAAAVLAGVPLVTKGLMTVLGKIQAHFRFALSHRNLQPRPSDLADMDTSTWIRSLARSMSSAKCRDSAALKNFCPTQPRSPTLT